MLWKGRQRQLKGEIINDFKEDFNESVVGRRREKNEEWKAKIRTGDERTERRGGGGGGVRRSDLRSCAAM